MPLFQPGTASALGRGMLTGAAATKAKAAETERQQDKEAMAFMLELQKSGWTPLPKGGSLTGQAIGIKNFGMWVPPKVSETDVLMQKLKNLRQDQELTGRKIGLAEKTSTQMDTEFGFKQKDYELREQKLVSGMDLDKLQVENQKLLIELNTFKAGIAQADDKAKRAYNLEIQNIKKVIAGKDLEKINLQIKLALANLEQLGVTGGVKPGTRDTLKRIGPDGKPVEINRIMQKDGTWKLEGEVPLPENDVPIYDPKGNTITPIPRSQVEKYIKEHPGVTKSIPVNKDKTPPLSSDLAVSKVVANAQSQIESTSTKKEQNFGFVTAFNENSTGLSAYKWVPGKYYGGNWVLTPLPKLKGGASLSAKRWTEKAKERGYDNIWLMIDALDKAGQLQKPLKGEL